MADTSYIEAKQTKTKVKVGGDVATTVRRTANAGGRSRPRESALVPASRRALASTGDAPPSEDALPSENEIVVRLLKVSTRTHHLEDELLRTFIAQGECVMDATDFIRKAGGIVAWLTKHHIELGINGKSHTIADNAVVLARAGYAECKKAIAWTAENRDRINSNRLSASASSSWRFAPTGIGITCRRSQGPSDRRSATERNAGRKTRPTNGLAPPRHRRSRKACADGGWNPRVLNAIRAEMDRASFGEATADALDDVASSD